MEKKMVDTKEACEVTGLKMPTIRKCIVNRTIPYYKIGGKILFKVSELNEWIDSHKVEMSKAE